MKLFPIEGNRMWLDGGSMFGNAPKALWEKWIPADHLNRILLSCRALLVQTDAGRNILFETGIGAYLDPKLRERYGVFENEHMLLNNLSALGFSETDIEGLVLSHLHFDHAGGLLSAYGENFRLLFPKAKYYLGKRHWHRALQPHLREKTSFIPLLHKLLADCDRLVLLEGDTHSDLDFVRFHYSDGHTVGLMLSEILQPQGQSVLFASDLIPGIPWVHLPITMGYDRFPELIVDEKKQLLEELYKKKCLLFFTHDPVTSFAEIAYNETGKWSALSKR